MNFPCMGILTGASFGYTHFSAIFYTMPFFMPLLCIPIEKHMTVRQSAYDCSACIMYICISVRLLNDTEKTLLSPYRYTQQKCHYVENNLFHASFTANGSAGNPVSVITLC